MNLDKNFFKENIKKCAKLGKLLRFNNPFKFFNCVFKTIEN